jgi:DNA processing protein
LTLLDPFDPDPGCRHLVRAWLRFHGTYCLDPVTALARLERADFDPERALAFGAVAPAPSLDRVEQWCVSLARVPARLLTIDSCGYPPLLRTLPDPPAVLFVQGSVDALADPLVAVVGARAATRYGLDVADALAADLARAGVCVVSGMARGIDGAAHRGALAAGGTTLALQACGPDRTYPPEHRSLRARIATVGAVISELPPGHAPRAAYFPLRNRLISGLARVVIVVEARQRSGSLVTMRLALDQGRDVMAVPGPIDAPTSVGPNQLLRDGARPVLGVSDVLDCLGIEAAGPDASPSPGVRPPEDPLEREILRTLTRAPLPRDALSERLGRRPEEIAAAVTALQLAGRVAQDRDGCLKVRAGPTGSGAGKA